MKKSLAVNSLYNIFYKLVTALYPLIAVTYVSHVLLSERLGRVSYAQNITSYFVVFAALGIPIYGTREIAKCSNNVEERTKVFWELLMINLVSTTIATLVYLCVVFSIPKFKDLYVLYLVTGLQIVLNVINIDWFYQGMEEYKYISIRSVIIKIISLILLPILVRSQDDYINYALIYCLATAGNNVFNILRIRKYIKIVPFKLKILKHLKPVCIMLVGSLAVEIYVMIDTTMLGFFCNDSIVGCYSNAMKLTRTVNTLAAAIGAVLLPRLSFIFAQGNKDKFSYLVNEGIKMMLVIAIPASLGLILLSDKIVLILFGESFMDAIPILRILSLMIPVVVCNTLMGVQVLITANMEWKYVFSVVIASLANVTLNALLIPKYGANSAAVASLVSEIIDLVLYIYFARSCVKLKLTIRYIISIAIPLLLYFLLWRLIISNIQINDIVYLVINIIICSIIYVGIGIALKNESMLGIIKKIRTLMIKNENDHRYSL